LSAEKKGFLPGVNGIQKHTHVLQAAVEEAKTKRKSLAAAWIDMLNAFGSVPYDVLYELYESIPIPVSFRQILRDIYNKNIMDFVVGEKLLR